MDNARILASIIIPVYNTGPYINECLDSVFTCLGTKHRIEVIVVNDASTDDSLDILNEYKKKHDFILITQKNSGAGGARNTGIMAANGKYLLFMDSDDAFVPDSLDSLLDYLADSNEDIVEYDYEVSNCTDRDFCTKKIDPVLERGSGQDIFSVWEKNGFYRPMVWVRAVSREMVISNKLYFCPEIYHEDEEWCPKIFAYARTVRYLPRVVYVYRIRDGSSMSNKTVKHFRGLLHCVESLRNFSCSGAFTGEYVKAMRRNFLFLYFSVIKNIKIDGKFNAVLIEETEKNKDIISFSEDMHRKYFYKFIIDAIGIKNFYILKYGYKDFFRKKNSC